MVDFDNFDTIDKTSLTQNNNTQKNDFDRLQEIFQIDEVGIMRLSKLVPDHMDNHEIFDEDFQRKIEFYQKFLGLKIQVNIIENEIFAGYKKVSVDIDGKINAQMWKYIFTQMIPYLESSGFQKSFLSLETLKDIPNEVFEQYMQFVNADFLQEKQNVVKDIILWLELAICTKLSQKRGYGDVSEIISGHENFQDALLNISHVAKMDREFQEKLEEMYLALLRYKNPKIQSLLKMLGYNVSENISSKKLIARTRSQFSISVAKILGSFGKKEEKPKKKIPVLNFRSAKKLASPGGGEMDWTSSPSEKNGRKNANYKFHIDTTKTDEQGRIVFPASYKINNGFDLDIFGGTQISELVVKNSNKTELEDKIVQTGYQVTFKSLLHGDYTLEIFLENGDKYIMSFHCDSDYSGDQYHLSFPDPDDSDYSLGVFSFYHITLKQVAGKIRVGKNIGWTVGIELLDNENTIDSVSTQVNKEVSAILLPFEGIETLENIFIQRQTLDIQSIFPQNISQFVSGRIFFDQEGFLHIDGKVDFQELIQKSDFGIGVKGLLSGDFDEENISLQKEKLTFVEFLDFVKETQARLQFYQEKDTKNGMVKLLQENLEVFKTDEKKRKLLSEIIVAKKQEFHPDWLDFYRELGKIDKDFRKFYTLSSLPKIEKVQVLKTLLERNHLSLVDIWGYLSDELKNKFFASFGILFDYEIPKKRFYEVLLGVKKELEYLLGDNTADILVVFDDLFGDDNFLALNEEISQISQENLIKKDIKSFFVECAAKRKNQIESSKEYIEKKIIAGLGESKTFEDLLEIKKVSGSVSQGKYNSFVSGLLRDTVRNALLKALHELDFERVGYYLQLDAEGANFLQELQKQDFNNTLQMLSFTQRNRGKGIIITQVCLLIDHYIVVQPKTSVPDDHLWSASEKLVFRRAQERKERKEKEEALATELSETYTEAKKIMDNIIFKDEKKILNIIEKENNIKYYNVTKLKE